MTFLRVAHRWLGLLLAVVVAAVAASGGLLLLRDPYYRAMYPVLDRPITAEQTARRSEVLTAIESRWSREAIRLVKFPQPDVNGFQVWLHDGTEAFVNPETGAVIDEWRSSDRLLAQLFDLHAHLFAGEDGEFVNGLVALFVVFMALTGVVLWWPARAGAFRLRGAIPRRLTPPELLRSHAAIGLLAAAPIVVFVATGAAMVFYQPMGRGMSALFDEQAPRTADAHVAPRAESSRPWAELLPMLDGTFGGDGRTVYYYPGTREEARLMFRKRLTGEWHPNGRSYVVIDPYAAQVVQAIDARAHGAGTRFMNTIYPVHAAKVGGVAMTIAAAFAAAALTWLAAGGLWSYLARRVVRRRRQDSDVRAVA
jgi:uncharacterized iron-regulated membrane protein